MTLIERFKTVRQRTEELCQPLKTEDYVPQPDLFVSPPKWHLAHTTWFFEEMILAENLQGYSRFHEQFSFLFNSYYNNVGNRTYRAHRGLMTRPTVNEVYEYRAFVDDAMNALLKDCADPEILDRVELGLNHEQQHQELLMTDLKYTLSLNPLHPVYSENVNWVNDENQFSGFIRIEEGVYEIGHNGQGFCFDNELARHKVFLQEFEIAIELVTNQEYVEFIADDGYENFNLWLDEGWSWIQENNISSPLY